MNQICSGDLGHPGVSDRVIFSKTMPLTPGTHWYRFNAPNRTECLHQPSPLKFKGLPGQRLASLQVTSKTYHHLIRYYKRSRNLAKVMSKYIRIAATIVKKLYYLKQQMNTTSL